MGPMKNEEREGAAITTRDGNRPGRPTGAYGLAYLKSSSVQLV